MFTNQKIPYTLWINLIISIFIKSSKPTSPFLNPKYKFWFFWSNLNAVTFDPPDRLNFRSGSWKLFSKFCSFLTSVTSSFPWLILLPFKCSSSKATLSSFRVWLIYSDDAVCLIFQFPEVFLWVPVAEVFVAVDLDLDLTDHLALCWAGFWGRLLLWFGFVYFAGHDYNFIRFWL